MKAFFILAACVLTCTSVQAQRVYRCTENGQTTYTQHPCSSGSGRIVNTKPNTISTSIAYERNKRFLEEREAAAQNQRLQRMASTPQVPTTANAENQSPACAMAIRNANTQSTSASPTKIDGDRAKARQVCGFDPWPGPSMAEIDARNRQSAALEKAARARMNPTIANCDAGGCWGTNGERYNGSNGGYYRASDGAFCVGSGGVLSCN